MVSVALTDFVASPQAVAVPFNTMYPPSVPMFF
jgi:hypothetical protein